MNLYYLKQEVEKLNRQLIASQAKRLISKMKMDELELQDLENRFAESLDRSKSLDRSQKLAEENESEY